jgi:hypothetical protein
MSADEDKHAGSLRKIINSQEQTLSAFRGQGINFEIIESTARFLEEAPVHPDFIKFQPAQFLYEKLDDDYRLPTLPLGHGTRGRGTPKGSHDPFI